jgi:hypothetical protein
MPSVGAWAILAVIFMLSLAGWVALALDGRGRRGHDAEHALLGFPLAEKRYARQHEEHNCKGNEGRKGEEGRKPGSGIRDALSALADSGGAGIPDR